MNFTEAFSTETHKSYAKVSGSTRYGSLSMGIPYYTEVRTVAGAAPFSARAKQVFLRLLELENLEENWDGDGATAPSQTALRAARRFVAREIYRDLPFYFCAPGMRGEVMVEFQNGDKAAELFFHPDGTQELLLETAGNPIFEAVVTEAGSRLISFFKNH